MLLQDVTNQVQISGAENASTSFRIAMNGKAFRVLSSTLYQDKIGSIVREISTNALDAHTMAGNTDEPFVIHLPDQFEPWFSVQDFGVGLSDEDVKNVYTVLFESTKDQSNDTVGAFGLGSKTPFSYTDQFTVTSVKDGIRNVYSAYITPSGVPDIIKMHSEETQDRNGVEVKLSVKAEHYAEFANKVKQQLAFFKVKPVVVNAPYGFAFPSTFEEGKVVAKATGFKLVQGVSGAYIVQGQVGYPFNIDLYYSQSENSAAKNFVTRLRYAGVWFIDCPIGSIGVTASREAVEYTEKTIKTIDARLLEIKAEIEAAFMDIQKNCRNNWEIAQIANETDLFGNKEAYVKAFFTKFAKPEINRGVFNFKLDNAQFGINKYHSWAKKPAYVDQIPAVGTAKIVIWNECKYAKQRIAIRQNKGEFFLIAMRSGQTVENLSLALGGYNDFEYLSDVQYTPTPRGTATKRSKTACWRYNGDSSIRGWDKEEDIPEDSEVVYVLADRMVPLQDEEFWTYIDKFKNLSAFIQRPDLYAIRKADEKAFLEANPEAKRLKDWVKETIEEMKPTLIKEIKREQIIAAANLDYTSDVKDAIRKTGSPLAKVFNIRENIASSFSYTKCTAAKALIDSSRIESKFAKMIQQIKQSEINKRPILKFDGYRLASLMTKDQLVEYLKVEF